MNDNLYSEIIMEHNKSNHNKREINDPTIIERGHNPNCGDDLTLLIKYDGQTIKEASFIGHGCAISQASMSIMIDLIVGKTVDYGKQISTIFIDMIRGREVTEDEKEMLADAIAFEGISKMPARVKCGTLGWNCLKVSLEKIDG